MTLKTLIYDKLLYLVGMPCLFHWSDYAYQHLARLPLCLKLHYCISVDHLTRHWQHCCSRLGDVHVVHTRVCVTTNWKLPHIYIQSLNTNTICMESFYACELHRSFIHTHSCISPKFSHVFDQNMKGYSISKVSSLTFFAAAD